MSEMAERVSRAIQMIQTIHGPNYDMMARAAIEAMLIPTSKMLADAVMSAVAGDPSDDDYAATGAVLERLPPTGHPDSRVIIAEIRRDYRAAINAALSD